MKKIILLIKAVLFLFCMANCQSSHKSFPVSEVPYCGQKPPGTTPEIFAPGVISTEQFEFGGTFSPDGTEFFFTRRPDYEGSDNRIYYTRLVNGRWMEPEIAVFSTDNFEFLPVIIPNGDKLFFYSERPGSDTKGFDGDLWYCLRNDEEWSEAIFFESPVNKKYTMMVTATKDGTLYFSGNYNGKRGGFKAKSRDGIYPSIEYLPHEINSMRIAHPFIAPDESYLIFDSQVSGMGKPELFICFHMPDKSWSGAINMGPEINATKTEFAAYVSPDGRYLFFHRRVNGNGDIYWVDASIINDLKPSGLR